MVIVFVFFISFPVLLPPFLFSSFLFSSLAHLMPFYITSLPIFFFSIPLYPSPPQLALCFLSLFNNSMCTQNIRDGQHSEMEDEMDAIFKINPRKKYMPSPSMVSFCIFFFFLLFLCSSQFFSISFIFLSSPNPFLDKTKREEKN